uniref:Uncharacterized protein n=1 Tax=Anopheles coluzzii TaxID=1518534 RepID=A0A8W7PF55_ANOCL
MMAMKRGWCLDATSSKRFPTGHQTAPTTNQLAGPHASARYDDGTECDSIPSIIAIRLIREMETTVTVPLISSAAEFKTVELGDEIAKKKKKGTEPSGGSIGTGVRINFHLNAHGFTQPLCMLLPGRVTAGIMMRDVLLYPSEHREWKQNSRQHRKIVPAAI